MDYMTHSDVGGSDLEALLFRSDILAPHEYWKVHRPDRFRQPELELMLAVLEDALHCYFTNVQMRTRREKKIFAFENICSLLGIDPDYIRRGLKLFKDAHRTPNKSDRPSNAIAA